MIRCRSRRRHEARRRGRSVIPFCHRGVVRGLLPQDHDCFIVSRRADELEFGSCAPGSCWCRRRGRSQPAAAGGTGSDGVDHEEAGGPEGAAWGRNQRRKSSPRFLAQAPSRMGTTTGRLTEPHETAALVTFLAPRLRKPDQGTIWPMVGLSRPSSGAECPPRVPVRFAAPGSFVRSRGSRRR